MKKIYSIIFVGASLLVMNGCIDSEDEITAELLKDVDSGETLQITSGSADFSNYIAIGNSITAGLMDGALYNGGQSRSYPNLMANQMLPAGGGSFNQPDINSQDGFNILASDPGNGVIVGRFVLDTSIPGPVTLPNGDITSVLTPYTGSVNNFGIPGARVVDLVSDLYGTPDVTGDGFPEGNPFYVRIASNPIGPGGSTVLGDAAMAGGSFVSFWIGQNDLLGYLASGGTSEDVTDNPAAIANPSSLTDEVNFTGALGAVVATLTSGGQEGVIANLLDASFSPFFRAVPYNALPLDQATADLLMFGPSGTGADGFLGFNAGLDQLAGLGAITQADADSRKISFVAGQNALLIEDDNLLDISVFNPALAGRGQIRQITSTELVLLTAATVIGTTPDGFPPTAIYGASLGMPDNLVLTADELTLHATRLAAFNGIIADVASVNDLATVDMYNLFIGIALNGGIEAGGQMLAPDFSPNGIFSTDGVHPNPRGQAIIANAFIDAINNKYGSNLQEIDVLNLPGVSTL